MIVVAPIAPQLISVCCGWNASWEMSADRIDAQIAGTVHDAETREEMEMMTTAPAAIAKGAICHTVITTSPPTSADGGPM